MAERRTTRQSQMGETINGGVTLSLLITIVFHVAMMVIGILNIDKCPVEPNIPIFLIAEGVIGLLSKIVGLFRTRLIRYPAVSGIISFVLFVEIFYFLFGTYWVYKEFKPNFDPSSGAQYCDKTVYMIAFSFITFIYVLFFALVICFSCFSMFILTAAVHEEAQQPQAHN